ncbi:MAG: DNA primase family protein [Acidimicrobiales bacterium]
MTGFSVPDISEAKVAPRWLVKLVRKKPQSPDMSGMSVEEAILSASRVVAAEKPGARNDALNRETFRLRGYIEAGLIPTSEVMQRMGHVGQTNGLGGEEISKTLQSALRDVVEPPADQTPRWCASSDPVDLANHLLSAHPHLRRWRGEWWQFNGISYERIENDGFKGLLWRHVARVMVPGKDGPKKLRTSDSLIKNISSALLGVPDLFLDGATNAPFWIGGPQRKQPHPDDLLVTANGIANIRTGELMNHTPNLFCTSSLPFAWVPDARCSAWCGFLDNLWGVESEEVGLLQEWFGYLLTQDCSQEKFLMLLGARRGGKGTIATVAQELLGPDKTVGGSFSSFHKDFGLWGYENAHLVQMNDVRFNPRSDAATTILETFLKIVGQDLIAVHRKNLSSLHLKLPCRIMICANMDPALPDDTGALRDRMMILRLTKSYAGQEDYTLKDRLRDPKEMQGILQWACEGLRRLRARGHFAIPQSSKEAVAEAYDDANAFPYALEAVASRTEGGWVEVSTLLKRFQEFAEQAGLTQYRNTTMTSFSRRVKSVWPEVRSVRRMVKHHKTTFFVGVDARGMDN